MTTQTGSTDGNSTLLQAYLLIEELEAKLAAATTTHLEPIAVVGMGCRFPNASNPAEFWTLLREGVDATRPIHERIHIDASHAANAGSDVRNKLKTMRAAFLEQVDQFDPLFFGISPREAITMTPEQRLMLEVAWEALENAGIVPHSLRNSNTGIFVGCEFDPSVYTADLGKIPSEAMPYVDNGRSPSITAGRLAYILGVNGPTFVISTACSSALVAAHAAARSLWIGECDLALVGGVQVAIGANAFIIGSSLGSLSPDGRCKTFDASANGYACGEGCGVVVLKRLADAQAAGDNILALIHSSAINHDGPSAGLTVPNGTAQEKLLRQALHAANVAPSAIGYIEAHGTGTPLGDPIEINSLGRVYGERETPLFTGSVKTNIGHLEAAAGIAGMIKVILSLQHQTIPPHLHFNTPNPNIPWDELPIQVPTSCIPWPTSEADGALKLAGVSSFGISGTNAHVILGEAPKQSAKSTATQQPFHLLTLSAKGPAALEDLKTLYARYLAQATDDTFADICYTTHHGRSHFDQRIAVVARDKEEARELLALDQTEAPHPACIGGDITALSTPTIAFLFTGQGSQYVDMGRKLYELPGTDSEPFRTIINRCSVVFQECFGRSLIELLYPSAPPNHNDLLESHPCGQAANFALQCALVEQWRAWGIEPDFVLGHSLGDFAAAYTAGVISLEDGLRLVTERGRLMETAQGSMVSVLASESEVLPYTAPFDDVAIGVINGPHSTVISGGHASVTTVADQLQAAGFKTRLLDIPVAAHSPLLDTVLDAFETAVRQVPLSPAQLAVVSSMTGKQVDTELTDPTYWRQHLRNTVRFADGVSTLHEQDVQVFLEIGPGTTLLSMAEEVLAAGSEPNSNTAGTRVLAPSLRKKQHDWQQMLMSLGTLYVHGVAIDWTGVDGNTPQNKPLLQRPLPNYPFQRERYWLESRTTRTPAVTSLTPLIDKLTQSPRLKEIVSETLFSVQRLPFLIDHHVFGKIVSPGACQLAMALDAARLAYPRRSLQLVDVVLPQALVLDDDEERVLQVVFSPAPGASEQESQPTESSTAIGSFELISFRAAEPENTVQIHATGHVAPIPDVPDMPADSATLDISTIDITAVQSRCLEAADLAALAALHTAQQIHFGPSFCWVAEVWRGENEAIGRLVRPDAVETVQPYQIHPALLDACLQLTGALQTVDDTSSADTETHLPFSFERFNVFGEITGDQWWGYVRQVDADQWLIQLLDGTGTILAQIEGFTTRAASRHTVTGSEAWRDWLFKVAWQSRPSFGHAPTYLPDLPSWAESTAMESAERLSAPAVQRQSTALRQLDPLCVDYILAAFAKAGFHFEAGKAWPSTQLARLLGVIPSYRRLLERLLQILAEAGILQSQDGQWQVVRMPELKSPQHEVQRLKAEDGALLDAELTLLTRCGEKLGEVMRGTQDPLDLLFPGGDGSLVNRTYQGSPTIDAMNRVMQQAVQDALAHLPANQGVRILEIGAGTGSTTATLLPMLPAQQTDYLFTDIGASFIQAAQEKFADFPFVRYQTLDIEQPPSAQGIEPHQFDIVIAANVLHATRDLSATLAHIQGLLLPGGVLLLQEGTRADSWVDLTFGLTDGWWRFADHRQNHPLLAAAEWQHLLLECGFATVVSPTDAGLKSADELGQSLLMAQRSESSVQNGETGRTWLLLADQNGMGETLALELQQRGETPILVYAGDNFEPVQHPGRNGEMAEATILAFHIRPDQPSDYQRLLETISATGTEIHGVIQLWGLDTPSPISGLANTADSADELFATLQTLCTSSLYLVQTVAHRTAIPRIWFVTQDAQPVLADDAITGLAQAALVGLSRTIALEHPEYRCQCIDLDGALPLTEQATMLCATVTAAAESTNRLPAEGSQPREEQIALRNGAQYVARLATATPQTQEADALPVRADGSYLLTGGLGGLGLLTARWLVEQGATHLLLLGRSQPSASAQTQIAEMETLGATITVVQADVSQRADVARALAQVPAEKPLRGVIHAAGVLDDGALLQQSWERFATVLNPKVKGAWHLHTLTQVENGGEGLDFFVLYSSAAGLLGSPGQANHSTSNVLLDALAHHRRAQNLPALSIDWGTWSEVGAAVEIVEQQGAQMAERGEGVIDPVAGIRSLAYLLRQANHTQAEAQVAVMPIEWAKYLQTEQANSPFYTEFAQQEAQPAPPNVAPTRSFRQQFDQTDPAQRETVLIQHMQMLAAQILGFGGTQKGALTINAQTELIALGMDSLMALEFRRKLETSLQVQLRSTLVFEYPTIGQLATHLLDQVFAPMNPSADDTGVDGTKPDIVAPSQPTDTTEMISDAMLDELSPEALALLLAQEIETAP